MKIDMPRLKAALRETAVLCKKTGEVYRDSNRPPTDGKDKPWVAALARDMATWRMTKLCIFRAYLRRKNHITKTRMPVNQDEILAELQKEFQL